MSNLDTIRSSDQLCVSVCRQSFIRLDVCAVIREDQHRHDRNKQDASLVGAFGYNEQAWHWDPTCHSTLFDFLPAKFRTMKRRCTDLHVPSVSRGIVLGICRTELL